MRTLFALVAAFLLATALLVACVGDAPPLQALPDSGGQPDAEADGSIPSDGSSSDVLQGGDTADVRPVPAAKGDFNWESVVQGQTESGIVYDSQGNAFFTYYFYNTTTVNAKVYTSVGSEDIMLVKYDPKGKVLWARQYGGAGDDETMNMTVDPTGDVYLLVLSKSTGFSFGGTGTYARKGTNYDGFVAKVSGTNGDGIWVSNVSKSNETYAACSQIAYGGGKLGIACFSYQGMALVKASDSSALTLSCLECGGTNPQYNNIYIASLDPSTGKAYWGTVIAADNQTSAWSMALDSKGAVIIDLTSFGTILHDATNSVNWTYKGVAGAIAIVAKLAASNGAGVWLKEFTDGTTNNNNQSFPGGLAVDSSDNVIFAGNMHGTVPFGIINLKSGGGLDAFVVQLKSAFGDVIWGRTFGGTLDERVPCVGVDPWDEIFVAGGYLSADAKVDGFNFPAVTSPYLGIFMTKLNPTGTALWATGIVSASTSVSPLLYNGLSVDPKLGGVAITGWFQGTVDLGDGTPVTSPGSLDDLFVVARNP